MYRRRREGRERDREIAVNNFGPNHPMQHYLKYVHKHTDKNYYRYAYAYTNDIYKRKLCRTLQYKMHVHGNNNRKQQYI